MAFNGSGTFVRLYNWVQDAANGILIRADRMDGEMDGFATGLSNCLTRDGQGKPSADIDWNAKKLKNLGVGSLLTDAASLGDIQSGRLTYLTGVAGTNTITATAVVAGSYAAGNSFSFVSAGANTGAVTLNVNTLGAKSIVKNGGASLVAGEIPSGAMVTVTYDGTNFQITGVAQPASLGGAGYQRLSSGLIEQWGSGTTSAGGDVGVSFTIPFPTALYGINVTAVNSGGSSNTSLSVGAVSTANANVGAYQSNTGARIPTAFYYKAWGQ